MKVQGLEVRREWEAVQKRTRVRKGWRNITSIKVQSTQCRKSGEQSLGTVGMRAERDHSVGAQVLSLPCPGNVRELQLTAGNHTTTSATARRDPEINKLIQRLQQDVRMSKPR